MSCVTTTGRKSLPLCTMNFTLSRVVSPVSPRAHPALTRQSWAESCTTVPWSGSVCGSAALPANSETPQSTGLQTSSHARHCHRGEPHTFPRRTRRHENTGRWPHRISFQRQLTSAAHFFRWQSQSYDSLCHTSPQGTHGVSALSTGPLINSGILSNSRCIHKEYYFSYF
jgi:hypothetical protein